jgi:hypothetical protein
MIPRIDLIRYFLCLKVVLIMALTGASPCVAQTTCTPSTVWLEDFTGLADGTSSDNGATAWSRAYTAKSGANFDVRATRFSAHLLAGGVATWTSQVINISSHMNVTFSVDLSAAGGFDVGEDYLKVYYKLNGGAETLLSFQDGPVSAGTVTSPALNGSTLQIIVKAYNTGDSEYYYFDNIKVKGAAASTAWLENFTGLADGTTVDNGTTAWSRTYTATTGANFDVRSSRFSGHLLAGGTAVWTSQPIAISSYANVTFSVDISSAGDFESGEDYLRVYYKLNGGSETLVYNEDAAVNVPSVTSPVLSGNTLQVIIKAYNTGDTEYYYFDNIKVVGVTPVATATGGTLNCSPSITITSGPSTSGLTYSWTGPNNFTSNLQNPAVSAAGTYTVTVTNPVSGCTSQATATVAQGNTTPPELLVWSSGILTDLSTSSELSASSGTANTTFTWNGFPAGESSIVVSNPGTYSVVARNTTTGCTKTGSIVLLEVPNTIWYEDFDNLPHGVTYHAGQAGWDGLTSDISGHFKVTRIKYEGTDLDKEVTWVSENINITHFTNVGMRVNLSSEGGLESGDYIKVSYKLDGGPETLFQNGEQHGAFSPVMATVSGLSGSRLKIIVRVYNTASDEKYWFDNVIVYGDQVPLPANVVWSETFNNVPDFATGSEKWTLDVSGTDYSSVGYCEMRQGRLLARDINGVAIWKSKEINIASYPSVSISADLHGFGVFEADEDYIKAYYKLNGGSEVLIGSIAGTPSIPVTVSTGNISGNKVQIILKTFNDMENERYTIDNVLVRSNTPVLAITGITGGTLSCSTTAVNLDVTTNVSSVTYAWTGPNGFTSTVRNPSVTAPGIYSVTVTSGSETATASITVQQNIAVPAAVTAAPAGALTCIVSDIKVVGSSATSNVTYSWTGPEGFSSALQDPLVTKPGAYVLTVRRNDNGCTATASATVLRNDTPPANVTATSSTVLTCTNTSTQLSGYSSTSGVAYRWTGPEGYLSNEQQAATTIAGTYTLRVTNPVNGCFASADVIVQTNRITPTGVVASVSGAITCAESTAMISGVSTTPGVTYRWSGPDGFTASEPVAEVSVAGIYRLTVTHTVSGCTASSDVTVIEDVAVPQGVAASASGNLTCTAANVTLTGTSTTNNVTYQWSGPDNFTSASATPVVSVPGHYFLSVQNPSNGCVSVAAVEVQQDLSIPADVQAGVSNELTCSRLEVTLEAISATNNVQYQWSGPGGFTSVEQRPVTSAAGPYTVTFKHPQSGCTTTANVTVLQNTTPPGINISNTSGTTVLTCYVTPLVFTGTSSTPGATFSWSSPNGYTANTAVATVTQPGIYTLTVTGTNGCTVSRPRTVTQNLVLPVATAGVSGPINCNNDPVALTGTSSASQVTFLWTGPGGFTSNVQSPSVTVAGEYILTITTPGGCQGTASVTVLHDACAMSSVTARTASGASEETGTASASSVYPNPVAREATLEWVARQEGTVVIEIYSMMNIRVYTRSIPAARAGETYTIKFSANDYAPGAYIYRVIYPGGQEQGKFIVL